jgi:hypothetical protein
MDLLLLAQMLSGPGDFAAVLAKYFIGKLIEIG